MSLAGIKDKRSQLIEIESFPNNAVQPSAMKHPPSVKVIVIEAADAALNTSRELLSTPCLYPLRVTQAIS